MLGSPSEAQRDADLAALLRFGLSSYRPARVVDRDRTYALVTVGWGKAPLALVAPRSIVRPAPTGRPLVERIVARSPLVAARAQASPTLAQKARWVAGRTVDRLKGLVS